MKIRPCQTPEELRDAVAAIVHYFGRERPDEDWLGRWLEVFELERMHAAVDDDGRVVGGAGAFAFRMTVPGGAQLPTAGVTVVGRTPTTVTPGDPPVDDARAARRRSRAR